MTLKVFTLRGVMRTTRPGHASSSISIRPLRGGDLRIVTQPVQSQLGQSFAVQALHFCSPGECWGSAELRYSPLRVQLLETGLCRSLNVLAKCYSTHGYRLVLESLTLPRSGSRVRALRPLQDFSHAKAMIERQAAVRRLCRLWPA